MNARPLLPLVLAATAAYAVPPTPALRLPVDAGWAQRQADLEAFLAPSIPLGVGVFDFEVHLTPGTPVYQSSQPVDRTNSISTVTHTAAPGLPDAGLLYWRARAVDDAGVASAWSGFEAFRIDDQPAPLPAPLTVDLDGGDALASWPAVADTQSGLSKYHLVIGQLDPPDASLVTNFDSRYQPTTPSQRVRLGPGAWVLGVHAHDQVSNFPGGWTPSAVRVVPIEPTLTPPQPPQPIRFDGGAIATFPYTRFNPVRWTWGPDAGPGSTGYVLIARATTGTAWFQVGESAGNVAFTDLDDGRYDVRVAALETGVVSDYCAPTQVVIDTTNPFTPNPSAQLDAGVVTVRWQSVRDRSGGSGVLEYRVERCCPMVGLPPVPDLPDASVSFVDSPGPGDWRWDVRAIDRATNVGGAGSAFLGPPPPRPAAPVAAVNPTRLPVALSWQAVDAGAAPVTWNVFRFGVDGGASFPLGARLAVLTASDPAPEGRWRYAVQAVAREQTSPLSEHSSEVLVDLGAPDAGTPFALRIAERELRISWDAFDPLSGLGPMNLFRESNGVELPLGPRTSPTTDLPPDGSHRYRVEVVDLAGNATLSAWSAPVATPGTTLSIAPVEDQLARCGQPTVVELTTTGEPATRWSLVGTPSEAVSIDPSSGRLTFTPRPSTANPYVVTVRAESAASLDEQQVTFGVSCEPVALAVACGCSAGAAPVALFGLALLLGARRRRSPV